MTLILTIMTLVSFATVKTATDAEGIDDKDENKRAPDRFQQLPHDAKPVH